ncbi:5-amino-6-(5-phospho-D-ribitylamino)uracil phosphatase YigB [Blochmannia endosymbiont of Polyrhachis (Hedomyrma) turneri]|uniref:5-amino-6-(5-phospho-D-ribitylamino)uracil phosphatase YigB n=1 Tax=Blochmannia endosymbiont of Polyrhachis (Hedomyrma) turneri TaxID=1505596 RepID=UPI00061A83E8|nr:5-amino-6-(5-phospho-D-ribitylamino)uracil phosphatase YigB [Blochmannia endosymbiont of Polyrhachis (Hedomyrma) turneri]AKC60136.1 flavin mononucleotide phosphatase YigB [Blochmannia endosymbiont of Polyrhachis (Hedomyrma) turneri]
MYFCCDLNPIFALSFDFDNTLYDNRSVIAYAEHQALLFLKRYHPVLCNLKQGDCDKFRLWLYQQDPNGCHDVTCWRWRSLELMLLNFGLSKREAGFASDCAMDIIIRWRSQVNISVNVCNVLLELASRWPLVAITNGNLDPDYCGLSGYFSYIFRAGRDGKAKPYGDMYSLAAKKLGLPCKNILHIGDSLIMDVMGAIISGMQSCWIYEYVNYVPVYYGISRHFSPHVKISSLFSLTNLL